MPPLSNTPAIVQKNKSYCLVYAVIELAADVCLALAKKFSDSLYLPHRKQLWDFTLNLPLMHFFHTAKWNGKWRRNKSALRKKHESLQRSEHLVLQDTVHVFLCNCLRPNCVYMCVHKGCSSSRLCLCLRAAACISLRQPQS